MGILEDSKSFLLFTVTESSPIFYHGGRSMPPSHLASERLRQGTAAANFQDMQRAES